MYLHNIDLDLVLLTLAAILAKFSSESPEPSPPATSSASCCSSSSTENKANQIPVTD